MNQAVFLAQYRTALEFIEATRHEPDLDVLLNEAMLGLGVPADSFDRFKFRFLNVARATEFAAREVLRLQYRSVDAVLERVLEQVLAEDARAILAKGSGSGQTMTLVNLSRYATPFSKSLPRLFSSISLKSLTLAINAPRAILEHCCPVK